AKTLASGRNRPHPRPLSPRSGGRGGKRRHPRHLGGGRRAADRPPRRPDRLERSAPADRHLARRARPVRVERRIGAAPVGRVPAGSGGGSSGRAAGRETRRPGDQETRRGVFFSWSSGLLVSWSLDRGPLRAPRRARRPAGGGHGLPPPLYLVAAPVLVRPGP